MNYDERYLISKMVSINTIKKVFLYDAFTTNTMIKSVKHAGTNKRKIKKRSTVNETIYRESIKRKKFWEDIINIQTDDFLHTGSDVEINEFLIKSAKRTIEEMCSHAVSVSYNNKNECIAYINKLAITKENFIKDEMEKINGLKKIKKDNWRKHNEKTIK